jgi:hypothetical protein
MIRIPFEEIVKRIAEKSGLPQDDILAKIETKCSQLSGLISKDGAAHIVANELGVQLVVAQGRLKIKDAFPRSRRSSSRTNFPGRTAPQASSPRSP